VRCAFGRICQDSLDKWVICHITFPRVSVMLITNAAWQSIHVMKESELNQAKYELKYTKIPLSSVSSVPRRFFRRDGPATNVSQQFDYCRFNTSITVS